MIARYHLHAGQGRSWNRDTAHTQFYVRDGDDLKELATYAKTRQDDFDWWTIFDADDGMSHAMGWSTGRTTPRLMEESRAGVNAH
jgi:hypothetical protein